MNQDEEDEFLNEIPNLAPPDIAEEVYRIWDAAVLGNETREWAKEAIRKYLVNVYGDTLRIDEFRIDDGGFLTINWSFVPNKKEEKDGD
jgi:hypothetical protein